MTEKPDAGTYRCRTCGVTLDPSRVTDPESAIRNHRRVHMVNRSGTPPAPEDDPGVEVVAPTQGRQADLGRFR